jgi:hypothetical protein
MVFLMAHGLDWFCHRDGRIERNIKKHEIDEKQYANHEGRLHFDEIIFCAPLNQQKNEQRGSRKKSGLAVNIRKFRNKFCPMFKNNRDRDTIEPQAEKYMRKKVDRD